MSEIKEYWNEFWEFRDKEGSQNDLIFQRLSHLKIHSVMKPCDHLLIIGCGDGDGVSLYGQKASLSVTGIDFSEPAIKMAQAKYPYPNHTFLVRDILNNGFPDGSYDVVISERCITNLPSKELQAQALDEVYRTLKPGGFLYLCEPSQQGYDAVDFMREKAGLPKLKRHWHNTLLDHYIVQHSKFDIFLTRSFGMYSLISKVVHPLYVSPEEPKFDDKLNRIASQIDSELSMYGSDLPSQHILYVLRKEVKW